MREKTKLLDFNILGSIPSINSEVRRLLDDLVFPALETKVKNTLSDTEEGERVNKEGLK